MPYLYCAIVPVEGYLLQPLPQLPPPQPDPQLPPAQPLPPLPQFPPPDPPPQWLPPPLLARSDVELAVTVMVESFIVRMLSPPS